MCFGPVASFTSAILLSVLGVATLREVRAKTELMFAGLPLLFGLHQLIEGFQWLALRQGYQHPMQDVLTFGFLLIALFVWPIYVPLSVLLLEENPGRRNSMRFLVLLGVVIGVYLLRNLIIGPREASIVNCSIYYDFPLPGSETGRLLVYVAATFGATLLSTRRGIVLIGTVNLISCAIAAALYYKTFVSVWCFYASVLSVMIFAYFHKIGRARS